MTAPPQRKIECALDSISQTVDPHRYLIAFWNRAPVPLSKMASDLNRPASVMWASDIVTNTETFVNHRNCIELARVADREFNRTSSEWATELDPWNSVIETGRRIWGDRWAFFCLANLAAGIKSTTERGKDAGILLDHSQPLCPRARYGRLRSHSKAWWQTQFREVQSERDLMFVALLALTWTRVETLASLHQVLDEALARLNAGDWTLLMSAVHESLLPRRGPGDEPTASFDVTGLPASLSHRTVAALSARASRTTQRDLYTRFLRNADISDPVILQVVQRQALDISNLGTNEWDPNLKRVQECYQSGAVENWGSLGRPHNPQWTFPVAIAKEIAGSPDRFPAFLLSLAEETCRLEVGRKSKPVADVAEREGWFGRPKKTRLL